MQICCDQFFPQGLDGRNVRVTVCKENSNGRAIAKRLGVLGTSAVMARHILGEAHDAECAAAISALEADGYTITASQ